MMFGKFIVVLLSGLMCAVSVAADSKAVANSNKPTEVVGVANLLKGFDKYKDKEVLVRGKVTKVCAKKGCWIDLEEKGARVKAMFKGGYTVAASLEGKTVLSRGKIEKKEVSEGHAKHLLEDAGASKVEINKVKGKQIVFHFMAKDAKVTQ